MTLEVEFQMDPMTLKAEMGEIYDVTGDEYEQGYADGKAAADAFVAGSATSYSSATLTALRNNVFQDFTALKTVDFPNVKTVGQNAFRYCSALTEISLPAAEELGSQTFMYGGLVKGVFPALRKIGESVFHGVPTLAALVLSGNTVCELNGTRAFFNSGIEKGTGYIYVPDELVDSYKAATNWSTYAAQIKPLSELEG